MTLFRLTVNETQTTSKYSKYLQHCIGNTALVSNHRPPAKSSSCALRRPVVEFAMVQTKKNKKLKTGNKKLETL